MSLIYKTNQIGEPLINPLHKFNSLWELKSIVIVQVLMKLMNN